MFDNVFWKSYISTVECLHQIAAAILELGKIQSNTEKIVGECLIVSWKFNV